MSGKNVSKLRFNFGFLLEATLGTSRIMEIDYPKIWVADDLTLEPLNGRFVVTRTSEGIYLDGDFHSQMMVDCVRCLAETAADLEMSLSELFYYPPETAPEGEYSIGENGFIDLAPLVREAAFLAMPMRPMCRENCLGLCAQCGQNLNEKQCNCEIDDIDPRLAALRQLLD